MVGRVLNSNHKISTSLSLSCKLAISDGTALLEITGLCDDGADESLVSQTLAESATCKGNDKMSAISSISFQVVLQHKEGNN